MWPSRWGKWGVGNKGVLYIIQGLYRDCIGIIEGLYRDYIGIIWITWGLHRDCIPSFPINHQ